MAKTQKEKLEAKLVKAEEAKDVNLIKAIKEELAALAKVEAPNFSSGLGSSGFFGGSGFSSGFSSEEAPVVPVDEMEALRKEVVAAVRKQGPNPLKRFRVVVLNGGHVVVNPNEQAVSPLDKPLSEGEANKICSRFNALVKPPKEALRKGGSSGSVEEQ